MMSYLNQREAQDCCDAFLLAMYGDELFAKWHAFKARMNFGNEREFVAWALAVLEQDFPTHESNTGKDVDSDVLFDTESPDNTQTVKNEFYSPTPSELFTRKRICDDDIWFVENKQQRDEQCDSIEPQRNMMDLELEHFKSEQDEQQLARARFQHELEERLADTQDEETSLQCEALVQLSYDESQPEQQRRNDEQCPLLEGVCNSKHRQQPPRRNSIPQSPSSIGGKKKMRLPQQQHPCAYCNSSFTYAHHRKRHEETVHGTGGAKLRCVHCGRHFSRKDNLKVHIAGKHPGVDTATALREACEGTAGVAAAAHLSPAVDTLIDISE